MYNKAKLRHVMASALVKYKAPELKGLIPVDSSASALATSWEKDVYDVRFTSAEWRSRSEAPATIASSFIETLRGPIKEFATGYEFTDRDLEIDATIAQTVNRAALAVRAIELQIERLTKDGDGVTGLKGLFNQTGTLTATASTLWSGAATAATMLADLQNVDRYVADNTLPEMASDILLVSPSDYNKMNETAFNSTSDKTVLDVFKARAVNIKEIKAVSYLSTEMVAYRRDPELISLILPVDVTPLDPVKPRYVWEQVFTAKCGGVVMQHPKSMLRFTTRS